jgi:elongation factor P hydroxylase
VGAIASANFSSSMLCVKRLEAVFAICFSERDNTRLTGGFDEPLYAPASKEKPVHEIRYREDFFSSALHEVAHWCIAGPARRLQTDFGYWYTPDGRNQAQQKAFERVEYKPQALEWFFSKSCGHPFRISVDNMEGHCGNSRDGNAFEHRVIQQAETWCRQGLPVDGSLFFQALCKEFGTPGDLKASSFSAAELS